MKVKLSFILFLGLSNLLLSQNVNLDSLFEPKLKGELFEVKAGFVGNEFNNNEWTLGDIQFNSAKQRITNS